MLFYNTVYNRTVMWSWWESIQWASGSEWWRQQNKTRHLRQWLLLTPFWTQLSLHTGWRDRGQFSLVPRPFAPSHIGKFSDGAWCGGSGDETGGNWWHKVDLVVLVCQLQFGLLPFVYFRPNGVLPALKNMIVGSMNQTVLIHRPSTSLNNMGEENPVTMVMATSYCCIII